MDEAECIIILDGVARDVGIDGAVRSIFQSDVELVDHDEEIKWVCLEMVKGKWCSRLIEYGIDSSR